MKPRNIIFLSLAFLSACGFQSKNSKTISEKFEKMKACKNLEPLFWHTLHDASLQIRNPSSWAELQTALSGQTQVVLDLVGLLSRTLGDDFWKKNQAEQLQIWSELELKVTDRPGWPELQAKMDSLFKQQSVQATQNCTGDAPVNTETTNLGTTGGRRVMAVAYQSCQAISLKPLNASTPDLQGIKVLGTFPKTRTISNLASVQATHPYLGIQNKENGCFDVENHPLIYDYGGKPYYANAGSSELDLTKNAGSGSPELGIDCSGLVFTAFAVQGYQLIPKQTLTGSLISGVSSRTLLNPPAAWKCVARINVGPNDPVQSGDVLSIDGHTVLFDKLGADPWGVQHFKTEADCAKITEDDLNFVILQSSSSNNGVGINRYQIKDYLKNDHEMRVAFLKYARAFCETHFTQTRETPQWSDVSIIRHQNTPDCIGRPMTLKYQSCVAACEN
jgi:hypothetical protein